MPETVSNVLARGASEPISDQGALAIAELSAAQLAVLCEAASARRDRAWGKRLTFSPKVFLPLTNLCRSACDYCSFRRAPGQAGAWTMSHAEVDEWLGRGREQGAIEALFCLGDRPEAVFPSYRRLLSSHDYDSTTDYLVWASGCALDHGLLPHTNAGVLRHDELARLRPVNASMGLMLENVSERLCKQGMPHQRAPDKHPSLRVQTTRDAGELAIPFTSGILIGIGETRRERVESLLAIRALHREYGHIQEVIVQNFRAMPESPMAEAPEPDDAAVAHAIALARLILPDEVTVQAPPNLNPNATALLIRAGVNDFGGISPVTPDYINPGHPWPHIDELSEQCAQRGFMLSTRLPIHDSFLANPRFVDPQLRPHIEAHRAGRTRGLAPALLTPGAAPGPSRGPAQRSHPMPSLTPLSVSPGEPRS